MMETAAEATKRKSKPASRKRASKQNIVLSMTLLILFLLTLYAFTTFDTGEVKLGEAIAATFQNLGTLFLQPGMKHFTFGDALMQAAITAGLAFLTTIIGAIAALILGLLAAENLSPKWLSSIIKGFVAIVRAVPTVLWVLIFAVAAGLGSVAAVIGMAFHSAGYLIKAYSESFEETDSGSIEALKASGAGWLQIVCQAVLPSSLTYLISWTFMRFEINFSVAIAMGAAAGAGGIGYEMFMASNFYYDLHEVGMVTYLILVFAVLLELAAAGLKRKLRVEK